MLSTTAYAISIAGTIVTVALRVVGADPSLTFGLSAVTILALAYVLGRATERLPAVVRQRPVSSVGGGSGAGERLGRA